MVLCNDRQNPGDDRSGRGLSRRRRVGPFLVLCLWCVLCTAGAPGVPVLSGTLGVAPAHAEGDGRTHLALGQPYVRGDDVWLDLTLTDLIRDQALEALHSGLPATVVFEWRIWQRRKGWWDEEVETGAVYYRVFYDVLQDRYDVFDSRGRSLASSDDPAEVDRIINDGPGLKLVPADRLHVDLLYYVEVRARIELLSDEEVRNLEEWLEGSGRQRSGRDPVRKVSDRLSRVIGGFVGPDDQTVVSKTDDFSGF